MCHVIISAGNFYAHNLSFSASVC